VISRFPVGLVLYWVTTNLWTVGQGLITRRLIPKTATPLPTRRTSRTPPKEDADSSGDGATPASTQPAKPAAGRSTAPPRRVKRKKRAGRR
jgi:YidC/Oxa1 family membrane protein insertase